MRQLNIQHEDYSVHRGSTLLISVPPGFKSFKGYDLSISGFIGRAEAYGFHVRLQTGSAAAAAGSNAKTPTIAGVLFLGKNIQEEEDEPARLDAAGIPHVFVNRIFDDPLINWVSIDHRVAARDAVFHLFGLGHRVVGTWGIPGTYRVDREKRVGYLRACEEKGLEVPACCLDFETHGDLEGAVQRLIDDKQLPPAWFAASDEHAMRFIKVARDNGVSVPEDVAIVGMDDVESAEYLNPSLTSVHIPFEAAGSAAFDVLKHLIENPHEQSLRIVLKHNLVIRESCGALVFQEAGPR
jgi:DNA-binding LacI/PurR family transcriptional regulator